MCGIFALISSKPIEPNNKTIRSTALNCARKLRHRGPDGIGYFQSKYVCLVHNRLAIISPESGNQPITNTDETLVLCVNGEIFNYRELRCKYKSYDYKTGSDCESILALYDSMISNLMDTYNILTHSQIVSLLGELDGQFSFVLHDTKSGMVFVARDPFGITQLYYGMAADGTIQIASEMKALEHCINVSVFESGNYMYFNAEYPELRLIEYFTQMPQGNWVNNYMSNPILNIDEEKLLMTQIKDCFETSVHTRLMCDNKVGFGILLSGGLDSSLVASVAVKYIRAHPEIYGEKALIHTFSIGDKDSTDLPYARIVADFLGTTHHEIRFTVEDGMNALENVIYQLETYDITTIRASTPHYLLAQAIQALGIKMVLSGEGSDELLGGYLYFHQAPTDEEHQLECKRRVIDLGYFDCLRADKSTMSNSLELRVPFLSTDFIKLCINIHKDVKTQKGIEKYILRKAFDIKNNCNIPVYLPDEVLWRQKEQFSDSITYRWIDTLKTDADTIVKTNSLTAYNHRELIYPFNTPQTTEAFYYRQIFEKLYPNREKTVKCWYPNTRWKGIVSTDPSGRAQLCHINTNA